MRRFKSSSQPVHLMRKMSLIAFTVVLVPLVSSFAATPGPAAEDVKARMGRAAELLAKRADADSLAAAGLLNVFKNPEQSLRQVAQASAMAPGRADLAWLHGQLCRTDANCDPQPLEMRLRALDEKNGAGWLGALARASMRGDEAALTVTLAAIGRTERVDIYWTTLIARLTRQVASTEAASLIETERFVIGVLSGVAIPAYQAVSNACKGERLLRADVVEACRGVASAFLNGDTAITEMIGVAIARRAWPENSPKWMEAGEARRTWDYRADSADSLEAWSETHAGDILALHEQHRREQDVVRAMLIATGRNPDPPPIQ